MVFKTDYRLMQVKRAFCNTFDHHLAEICHQSTFEVLLYGPKYILCSIITGTDPNILRFYGLRRSSCLSCD